MKHKAIAYQLPISTSSPITDEPWLVAGGIIVVTGIFLSLLILIY